ncbi:PAS domain S-box protein [Archaeoglobus neptunius]|uniref:PAS domain S-box protein n=1 Tax=Archaeoglobus neptunius TaxID=2798580 RepID=UPI001928977F|nr:PAS domain S-box protein [Archaeoglobus neptunius]
MSQLMLLKLNRNGKILSVYGLPKGIKGKRFEDVFEISGNCARLNGRSFAVSRFDSDDGSLVVLLPEQAEVTLDDIPIGIVVLQDGKIVYANNVAEKVMGYTRDEIESMDLCKSREVSMQKIRAIYERCIKEGKFLREELKVNLKSGVDLFVEVLASKGYYMGRPAIICAFIDINRRKELEELFLTLTNQTFVAVYIIQDGKFVFLNEMATISGYTIDELYEMDPFQLVHPEDRKQVIANYIRRIAGEQVEVPYRFRLIKKDGEVLYVDAIAARVFYRGKPAVMGILIDRTEDVEREEKLKRYERFFRQSKDMFFIIDREGRFVDVNPRYREILGYDYSELLGKTSRLIAVEEDIDLLRENFKRVLNGESVKFTFRIRRKNGDVRICEVVEWPVFKDGRVTGAEGVLRDITDRIVTETELKTKNELLKTVSEINELILKEKDEYALLSKVCRFFSKLRNTDSWAWIVEKHRVLKATPLSPECGLADRSKQGEIIYEKCSCPMSRAKSLAVPIKHNGNVYGVVVLCSVGNLSDDELKILEKLGENLGFAITSYRAERDRKIAFNLLLENLEQFESLADKLRNPVAIISGFIEIKDDIGCERVVKEIENHAGRIKEILDELRLQETLTYFILRGGKV